MRAAQRGVLKPGCLAQVKILRPESYWFRQAGKVVSVDQVRLCRPLTASCYWPADVLRVLLQSGIRYPVVVRFKTVNYAGVSTNNYAFDEVEQL